MIVTLLLRQTDTPPPNWKPGQPLPASVPKLKVEFDLTAGKWHWAQQARFPKKP